MSRSSAKYEKLSGHAKLHARERFAMHTVMRLEPMMYWVSRFKIDAVSPNSVRLRWIRMTTVRARIVSVVEVSMLIAFATPRAYFVATSVKKVI